MDDTRDMQLLRRDYTEVLRESCKSVLAATTVAEEALCHWPASLAQQPAIDRSLVRLMLAVHRAEGLILPAPDAMEYFGLPRSATARAFDPDPTIRVQDPGRETWDFRPWLSEKLTRVREHLHSLMDAVETGLECVHEMAGWTEAAGGATGEPGEMEQWAAEASSGGEETPAERAQERALYELRAARTYTRDILSAIDKMGLTVVDWRLTGEP